MTAEVLTFPRVAPSIGRPARFAGPVVMPRREYCFADVVKLLSLVGQTRTLIAFLRDLHTQCGLPLPKNPRRWGGQLQVGARMIDSNSRWCALEFDAWLDSQRSPPPAALAEWVPPLPVTARADMAARAAQLAHGSGSEAVAGSGAR